MITSATPSLKAETHHLSDPKYRPDIDGLRAVAVLLVIGFHAFPNLVQGGFIGVDIFFVISGFLISTIIFRNLEENRFSYVEFYSRRIRRIFPALILVLTACLICGWFEVPNDYKQLGKHVAAGAGFVSNIALWGDAGYFDAAANQKPLLHLWSLGIEEQFYILWPALLGLVWNRKYNYFLTVILLILGGSFFVNVYTIHSHPVAAFYSPLSRFWELMIGGLLAYLTLHRPDVLPKKTDWLPFIGLLMISTAALFLTKDSAFPGWWALLPTVGAFLILSAGPGAWLNRNLLGNRVFVWIGLISYPLYLWHWPALYVFNQLFPLQYLTHWQFIFGRLCTIGVSILLSWLTYRIIEIPIRSGHPRQNATYAIAGGLALVAAVGLLTYETNGFASRLPPKLAAILSFDYAHDSSVAYRLKTCLLEADEDQTKFSDCTSVPSIQASNSVLLWGDSHAAQLYPGMQAKIGSDSKITQFTASLCPPIVGYVTRDQQHCKEINDYVMNWIAKEKPDRVILGGLWGDYEWKRLGDTISRLKLLGVTRIDVVGPVPRWKHDLPAQLFLYTRRNKSSGAIPARMSYGLDGRVPDLDDSVREFAKEAGVNYFSPYGILCNYDGCLTKVGEMPQEITAWDTAHLTPAASRYVVSHFTE